MIERKKGPDDMLQSPIRQRLANRRPSATIEVWWTSGAGSYAFSVSVGYDVATGQVLEVFYADGMKEGTDLRHVAQDACVLISLALQHGVSLDTLGKSLASDASGTPASLVGAIVAMLAPMAWHEL